jgi:aryl-alcohol dehydrogenase-like predicted oxidoreductase
LGRTELQVSEIGFGTWGIGGTSWIGAADDESKRALKLARDSGINFFDTALVYGQGHSEQLLVQVLGSGEDVIIATKVPPLNRKWPAPPGVPLAKAFPRAHVLECARQSLQNLNRECIDLLQFHVWSDGWADDPEWLETASELKRTGMVRFVGISINDHQPENGLQALQTGLIDAVQVIYNVFDQSPEDRLFPYCLEHDIGVIARVPFDEGSLAGKVRPETIFPERDFRNYYFSGDRKAQVWQKVQEIAAEIGIGIERMPTLALKFCLSHLAVASVIPGMRTTEHVRTNAVADGNPLPEETIRLLRKHRWIRNFYTPSPTITGRLRKVISRLGNRHLAIR